MARSNLIIALVLLSTACPAAGASVMRITKASVQPGGEVEMMQTESVSGLADMFSDDPEAKAMTAKLLQGTPSDDLLPFVQRLKEQIQPWHDGATASLNTAIEAIGTCTAGMENGMREADVKKDSCNAKSTSHTTHRTDESTKFSTKEHWAAETAEKLEEKTTECNAFQTVKDEAKSATASYGGGDEGAYLESVSQQFCSGLLPRYRDHKEKCTTATAEHERVSQTYETKNTEYTVQKTASDTVQTEMDVACCEHALATKDVCTSHDTCYEDKVAAYNAVKAIVEAEEKVKKTEWRVYSRIECLLPILGTNDAAKIEECRATTHSTAHLDIDYPAVPEKSTCNVEEVYPGTQAYKDTHFGALPENAKGEDVAVCTGMGSGATPTLSAQAVSAGPTEFRYWKLEMRQNDNPVCQVFQEIEFICNGEKRTGVNAMEASDHYLEYHASKAVDGNENTYWAKCHGGHGAVDWITFDLGSPCSLTDVKTKSRAHQGMQMQPDVMLLQASTTGEDGSWQDVHEWNNPNNPNWQEIQIPEGAGR